MENVSQLNLRTLSTNLTSLWRYSIKVYVFATFCNGISVNRKEFFSPWVKSKEWRTAYDATVKVIANTFGKCCMAVPSKQEPNNQNRLTKLNVDIYLTVVCLYLCSMYSVDDRSNLLDWKYLVMPSPVPTKNALVYWNPSLSGHRQFRAWISKY